jgi:hypothetical protein
VEDVKVAGAAPAAGSAGSPAAAAAAAGAAAAGAAGSAAASAAAAGSGASAHVPYERFQEVNKKAQEYGQILDNLGNDPEFNEFVKLRESGKSLKQILADGGTAAAGANTAVAAAQAAGLGRSDLDKLMADMKREIGTAVGPLQQQYYSQVYERMVADAEREFGPAFDRIKHLDEVRGIQRRIPGLSVAEAFRLTAAFDGALAAGGLRAIASGNRTAVGERSGGQTSGAAPTMEQAVEAAAKSGDWRDVIRMKRAQRQR